MEDEYNHIEYKCVGGPMDDKIIVMSGKSKKLIQPISGKVGEPPYSFHEYLVNGTELKYNGMKKE